MRSLVEKGWAWLHTHEGRKIFRYSMVSVITTIVSNVTILIVYGGGLLSEVPATVFGNFVATFPSYWLNRQWAWGKHGRSHLVKEVVPFWTVSIIGIAFSMIGAAYVHHLGQKYGLSHFELTILVVVANVLSFAIFWVLKLLLFNRLFKVHTLLEEIDEHLDEEEDRTEGAAVR
jgi:putative flippase GtrA